MKQSIRFLETPNGTVVVADVDPLVVMDKPSAERLCKELAAKLGNLPVILRCMLGDSVTWHCDEYLRRYTLDPLLDYLPVVEIHIGGPLADAA
jgi:hypothetical protein